MSGVRKARGTSRRSAPTRDPDRLQHRKAKHSGLCIDPEPGQDRPAGSGQKAVQPELSAASASFAAEAVGAHHPGRAQSWHPDHWTQSSTGRHWHRRRCNMCILLADPPSPTTPHSSRPAPPTPTGSPATIDGRGQLPITRATSDHTAHPPVARHSSKWRAHRGTAAVQ